MSTVEIKTPWSSHQVPDEKLTSVGRYLTAREAYDMWKAQPGHVHLLDVRTFEEYVLIGHAEMAANVPLAFPTYSWDVGKGNYTVLPNMDFVTHVAARFAPDDTILVMCRSGGRSAMAINALAKAGFINLHNIIDGFEGDKVDDPESVYHGQRVRNGWKNSAPWTYKLNSELVWLPSESEIEALRRTLDL